MRLESLGIPCEHIVSVLIHLNIIVMPNSIILPRWTKGVKDAVNAANANSSSQHDPAFVTSYATLVERCKRLLNAAFQCGNNPEEIRNTNDLVENQTERLELVGSTNRDEPSFMDTQTGGSIGNPPPPPSRLGEKVEYLHLHPRLPLLSLRERHISVVYAELRDITKNHVNFVKKHA